ncbi:MAG: ATP-binding protein [Elusimicrobia bacterium]|nr:MAG: ATP-binding protein [Gammaproteobacteria bacterium]TXH24513.1 MAG: ATP-binding protein [Elusimicrobiota bacterium]
MANPVLLSWSGGKDSLMALDRLLADPEADVVGLLSTLDHATDRVAIHEVRGELIRAQAHALDLPLVEMAVDWPASNTAYLGALAKALRTAEERFPGLRQLAFGDLHLQDLRQWREAELDKLGWVADFPLWKSNATDLIVEFDRRGHCALVVSVDLEQVDESVCGLDYDAAFRANLPVGVDRCGENGEFHTFCHASPLFKQPIAFRRGTMATRSERFRYLDLEFASG